MRAIAFFGLTAALVVGLCAGVRPTLNARQKDDKKDESKLTPAAEQTLTKLLKAKVSVRFTEARLGDVLKEFSAQVDTKLDVPVMWTYGKGFPYAQAVTYSCKDKPLDAALDELFKKLGGTLGYIVVSKDGDRRDGWILLTTTGERGAEKLPTPATAEQEADASAKLALAKRILDRGKNEDAKKLLEFILERYPTAKAATEAKEMLKKIEK